jgi:hypothetical protein
MYVRMIMGVSFYRYDLSCDKYILERMGDDVTEYFYCRITGNTGRTAFCKGKIFDGKIEFVFDGVIFEISRKNLESLERRQVF